MGHFTGHFGGGSSYREPKTYTRPAPKPTPTPKPKPVPLGERYGELGRLGEILYCLNNKRNIKHETKIEVEAKFKLTIDDSYFEKPNDLFELFTLEKPFKIFNTFTKVNVHYFFYCKNQYQFSVANKIKRKGSSKISFVGGIPILARTEEHMPCNKDTFESVFYKHLVDKAIPIQRDRIAMGVKFKPSFYQVTQTFLITFDRIRVVDKEGNKREPYYQMEIEVEGKHAKKSETAQIDILAKFVTQFKEHIPFEIEATHPETKYDYALKTAVKEETYRS